MLEVKNLKTEIATAKQTYRVLDDVSFTLKQGHALGIVGESGSGKSMTSLSILKLISPPGRISGGEILFEGRDLLKLPADDLRSVRGSQIGLIFQEPHTSLNPTFTVAEQLKQTIALHQPKLTEDEIHAQATETLRKVHLSNPQEILEKYPHQLSGGQQQRVLIGLAICCNPKLLIADEATTALDSSLQLQILNLLKQLKQDMQLGLVLITHDLAVVGHVCDEVAVMYAGQIIETGSVSDIFKHPRHPYTKGLLESAKNLKAIPGSVAPFDHLPVGCRFAERCPYAQAKCLESNPRLESLSATQSVACYFPLKNGGPA